MAGQRAVEVREDQFASGYQVRLASFQGPLDLLCFLIQRDQIDIHDIPIAQITREYLEYLKLMRLLNLDVAAEFLVLAATLMFIKSQMLVPRYEGDEAESQEDPRQQLVDRLLEYRLFKAAAGTLEERAKQAALLYARPGDQDWGDKKQDHELIEVSLYDLLAAFKDIVERGSGEITHQIVLEGITVKERFGMILDLLSRRIKIPFEELFRGDPEKMSMVVTFLAVLELMRAQLVSVKQRRPFGEIWICRKKATELELHPFC